MVIDKVPASKFILALLVKLILPVNILFPEILLIAPKLDTPKPPIEIGSALFILFWTCKLAPLLTMVFPTVVPNPLLLWTFTTPVETFITPS